MRTLLLLVFFLVTGKVTHSQNLQFTFEGDSTTIPLVRDSLRGISGLDIVPATGDWHLVSDRGWHFVFHNIHSIRDLGDVSRLARQEKTPFWFEGIRYAGSTGTYFWTDEYENVTSLFYGKSPSDSAKHILLRLPLPGPNKGLEGIAVTPSGALWVAPEAGWEGETRMNQDTITFFYYPNPLLPDPVVERYRYPINRCPFAQGEERLGGISEILAVDNQRLLILERCYDASQKRVMANLYLATQNATTHTLTKELAFDFNRQFPDAVCNLEAMAWADDQKQTLVLMADDNFRRNQTLRNQVIVLRRR
ncbi:esterase-like activity of phytase family protein [Spirosoma endbachense]|uniref:Esterase-like activity of phytase family protein n=1 Tax=Spirosoma endbachense TaxID=2666025 RepID=A0A6P1W189_9BACT|nr:esterase-like activity of phytase family protein [Spirosoma endbachense]QHV98795.1 esterase-like activity of phytase family protein [Spirosoma endbachense]